VQLVGVAQKLQKKKLTDKNCLLFVKDVGHLCYSPHQLNNAFLDYFPTENSLIKHEI